MRKNLYGFSFIELIIVISIIALISVIGLSINSNYTEKSKNSRITSDVLTLKNSIESYRNDNKTLPMPKGNQKFFDNSSNYVHYDDPTAFGVNGYITGDTIPKKYLDNLLLDPRTNQYYAYGKTLTGSMYFEIAGVNKINGNYESKVVGDYSGETGPYNLIREYNGPDFVFDKSRTNFPYNPDERLLKAKIGTFSGFVIVNGAPINNSWIKNNELTSGDIINVSTGGMAEIYYSDGSKSYLGDELRNSVLTLANMKYKEENNLFTKIQLALNYGSIWIKTSKLDPNSNFEVYTTDTEAAVRGTIFGVSKDNNSAPMTKVSVETGSVNIVRLDISKNITYDGLVNDLKNGNTISSVSFENTGTTDPNIVINPDGSASMFSSGTLIETIVYSQYIHTNTGWNYPILTDNDGLSNIIMTLLSIGNGEAKIGFPTTFSGSNKFIFNYAENITQSGIWDKNILILKGLTDSYYSIKICSDMEQIRCTKDFSLNLNAGNFENTDTLKSVGMCDDFGQFGCISKDLSLSGYTLVAYAPYDKQGDINMYTSEGKPLPYNSDGIIPDETKPMDQSIDSDSSISGVNDSPDYYNSTYSFYDKDGVKGIFIGSGGTTPDYLKYDMSSLGLGDSFAVEMGVRGGALKRNIGGMPAPTFYLFFSDNYNFFMANSGGERFLLKESNLSKINTTTSYFSVSALNDNSFYKLIYKKDLNNGNLNINGTSTGTTSLSGSLGLGNYLNIGETPTNLNQWDDIIDYIKIYKK
nr:FecR family protein [Candidatus Gracilibacteria bacterium]